MKHRIKHHAIQRESDHRDEAQAEKTAKADEQGVDETERRLHADPPGSAEQSKREQKPVCYRVEHASIAMDPGLDASLRTQNCRMGVEALVHFPTLLISREHFVQLEHGRLEGLRAQ